MSSSPERDNRLIVIELEREDFSAAVEGIDTLERSALASLVFALVIRPLRAVLDDTTEAEDKL